MLVSIRISLLMKKKVYVGVNQDFTFFIPWEKSPPYWESRIGIDKRVSGLINSKKIPYSCSFFMTLKKVDFDIVMSKSWQWQDSDNRKFEIFDSDKTMTIRKFDSQKITMTSRCHDRDSDWQWQCLVHCHADLCLKLESHQNLGLEQCFETFCT